jgi:hypothetical protein
VAVQTVMVFQDDGGVGAPQGHGPSASSLRHDWSSAGCARHPTSTDRKRWMPLVALPERSGERRASFDRSATREVSFSVARRPRRQRAILE